MERNAPLNQQSSNKDTTAASHYTAARTGSTSQFYLQDHRPKKALQLKPDSKITSGITSGDSQSNLPAQLKSGVETLSGLSMDDVKVHYNSDKPAQLQAHAYARGSDIHIAPGQEKHLPHEAWHVAQQKQGRVQPTLQMKGKVSVNDDAGLEKEADVMGARALNAHKVTSGNLLKSTSSGNITQMVINAGSFRELLAEQESLEDSVAASNIKAAQLSTPGEQAAPRFEIEKLYDIISRKGINIKGINVLPALVGHFIREKKAEIEDYAFPEDDWDEFAAWLKSEVGNKHVTAGFEFEFSSMEVGNPFEGVTHVELSKSQQIINKLPFVLETDAGNALELVTPPFFLEAIDSEIPLPKPKDAEMVESLIKARLGQIAAAGGTMKTMAEAFEADPGLTFKLPQATVTPKSLSDRSFGKFTAGKDTVSAEDLENIGVGEIKKYRHGGIDTQINIATDATSYAAFIELEINNRERNIYVKQFYTLQKALEDAIKITKFEEPLKGFLRLFLRNIAGQLAIPSMDKIFSKQEEAFQTGKSEKKKDDLDFDFYAWASSGVKDIGNIWIKDNIINIGIGMLKQADWVQVLEIIDSNILQTEINQYQVPDYLIFDMPDGILQKAQASIVKQNRATFGAYYQAAKVHMLSATNILRGEIMRLRLNDMESNEMVRTPAVPFMIHDPMFINPRQDTHLPPDKVQLPAWKQRLHVAEIRSNPIEGLRAWAEAAANNKAIKEQRRVSAEKFEKKASPADRYNKLLTDKKIKHEKITPDHEKLGKLTMDEYATIEKRLNNMDASHIRTAMKQANDLTFDKAERYPYIAKALANDELFAEFDQ